MDNLNKLCHLYKFDEKDTARMLLSGYLSGIGVLRIPQSILQNCEPSIEIKLLHGLPTLTPLFSIAVHRGLVVSIAIELVEPVGFLDIYFL